MRLDLRTNYFGSIKIYVIRCHLKVTLLNDKVETF